jgi:hypothetical protein
MGRQRDSGNFNGLIWVKTVKYQLNSRTNHEIRSLCSNRGADAPQARHPPDGGDAAADAPEPALAKKLPDGL